MGTDVVRIKSRLASVAITFALFGFACLAWTGVCWADWILFAKTEAADLYYDKDDITHSSAGTAYIWVKYVYTELGVKNKVNQLGLKFENLDHSIALFEFDCVGKLVLSLSAVYFSKEKAVLEIKEAENGWKYIPSGSPLDSLYGKACK